jgi:hypothetical protein
MAAALKRFWEMAQWRWTPFFGLVGGSLLYVLLVILIVPNKIGAAEKTKPGQDLRVIGDESPSSGSETMGAAARTPGGRPFSRPGMTGAQPGGMSPPPPPPSPMLMPQPPMDPRMGAPEAPPPPPPPPQQEEPEVEEEQGANPMRTPNRALAGALRMLPPPTAVPAAPEPEPEPDEPDDEDE